MEKVVIGYKNRIDEAVLSGGNWQAPLTNIQTLRLAQKARSVDAVTSSTKMDIFLPKSRMVNILGVHAHNISVDGTVRFYAGTAPGLSDVYDSGVIEVWPALYSTLSMHWQDFHFWSGKIDEEVRKGYPQNFVHVATKDVKSQYWTIEIYDPTNSDGYIEVGRVFLGRAFRPVHNVVYGATLSWDDSSKIDQSLRGVEYFDTLPMTRTASIEFDYLDRREALEGVLELQRESGTTREVLFIANADDAKNMVRLAFLGRFRKMDGIKWHFLDLHQSGFEIKELL